MTTTTLLLWLGLALGAVFGFAARAGDFCTRRAILATLQRRPDASTQVWVAALLSALIATAALAWMDLADPHEAMYAARRLPWLSHLFGGLLFGLGMQLAAGCPSRKLLAAGGGDLGALVVLSWVALGAGLALHGAVARFRVDVLDAVAFELPVAQTLPALFAHVLGSTSPLPGLALQTLVALALGLLLMRGTRHFGPRPILAGLVIGLSIAGAWFVTSHLGFLPEDPETLQPIYLATASGRPEALSFVGPLGQALDLLLLWSDRSRHLAFGSAAALGCLTGALAQALLAREWRWRGFADPAELGRHLTGALLMGVGGVIALGCTIGHGLSGLSLLSLGSLLSLVAIAAGVELGRRLFPSPSCTAP